MIFLYTLLLLLLGAIKLLVNLRARALERKFIRLAGAVDQLLRQSEFKPGNNKHDPCVSAKRTFLLGQLVELRDHVEARHYRWQHWVERLSNWLITCRGWQGKKLPYTLGVIDVSMVLSFIDCLGAGQYLSVQTVIQLLMSLFTS